MTWIRDRRQREREREALEALADAVAAGHDRGAGAGSTREEMIAAQLRKQARDSIAGAVTFAVRQASAWWLPPVKPPAFSIPEYDGWPPPEGGYPE